MNRTALILIHGIGQQTRYQIVDDIAVSLMKVMGIKNVSAGPTFVAKNLTTPSTSVRLTSCDNFSIDIYESYWSPNMKGRTNIFKVLTWLVTVSMFHIKRLKLSDAELKDKTIFDLRTLFLIASMFNVFISTGILIVLKHYVILLLLYIVSLLIIANFLVDYIGDIQVYMQRDENSDFYDCRELVLQNTIDLIRKVCSYQHISYDKVVIAGHSLGSVIGLDALIRLCDESQAEYLCDYHDKISTYDWNKISDFISFGSPIAKTQFFFNSQSTHRKIRFEQNTTPKLNKIFTKINWLNFWYSNDLIADPLRSLYLNCKDFKLKSPSTFWSHSEYFFDEQFIIPLRDILKSSLE